MDALIGCVPTKVWKSDDGETLVMALADGRTASMSVEGDCCSRSWIEYVSDDSWRRGPITAFADGGQVADWERDSETIKVYQVTFKTEFGSIVAEFRNESNGYYGGYLNGPTFTEPEA